MSYITPVERAYRTLSQPAAPQPKPALAKVMAKVELTRDDVTAILEHRRSATAAELEQIISNAAYKLSEGEREQLSLALTIQIAQARQSKGKPEDPSTRLIYELGYAMTPYGLLHDRVWFERELQAGTKAIAACRRHSPPCSCWKAVRENLYDVRASFSEKSPESFAALRIWEALEEMELAERAGK